MMNWNNSHSQNSSQEMQIEGLGTIYTSRNQKKIIFVDSPKFIDQILGSLHEEIREQRPVDRKIVINKQMLLEHRTSCQLPISKETKKKVIKIRNKNLHYFLTKTNNRYVIETCEKILDKLKNGKNIHDPSKSLTFFFLELALLTQYRSTEVLFNIFDTEQTTKSNKKTHPCSEQEKQIIRDELQFFKEIAKEFYDNQLRAILMAYLRNHEINKLQKGSLDSWTRKGILETIKILNQQPFNSDINAELPFKL